MSDEVAIHRVTEGAEPEHFRLEGVELPKGAQVQVASEAPYIVKYEPNPLDVAEGQYVFGRAGVAKVVLTWHTVEGVFITRRTEHFMVQPEHWTANPP